MKNNFTDLAVLMSQVEVNETYGIKYVYDVYEYQNTKQASLSYSFTSMQVCDAIDLLEDLRKYHSSDDEVRAFLEQIMSITGRLKNDKPMLPQYPPNIVNFIRNALNGCTKSQSCIEEYAAMLIAVNIEYLEHTMEDMKDFVAQQSGSIDDYEFNKTVVMMDEDNNIDFINRMSGAIIKVPGVDKHIQ